MYTLAYMNQHHHSCENFVSHKDKAQYLHIQGWAMKREDFKGVVGLTVVEWGGEELASPLLQVLPFSSNAAVDS